MGLVTLPTVWLAKQLLTAAKLNGNFNAILNQLNGNIEDANMAALSIATRALQTGAVTGPKIAMGSDAQGDVLYYDGTKYARLPAGTAGQVLVSGGAGANPLWGSSKVIQVVNYQLGTWANGSTAMQNDDSIPQITEGDQYMSLAITPSSATNKLKIEVVIFGAAASATMLAALFQDSNANALAAGRIATSAGDGGMVAFTHYMTAGTTSATTFKVRAGGTVGSFGINGNQVARYMGGVMASSITITEVKV